MSALRPIRRWSCVVVLIAAMGWSVGDRPASAKTTNPCVSVRDIELPSDEFSLNLTQIEILECVRHLQLVTFGKDNKQQCVPFANALMNVLRPAMRERVVGQSAPHTAGRFTEALRQRKLLFARDEVTGLPVRPSQTRSRPVFIWWDTSQKVDGHVGVYIGGGLFVDAYVGYELAKLSAKEMRAITDASRWSWSATPKPQTRVPWPEGHWPRQRVNDGYSVVRVRGG